MDRISPSRSRFKTRLVASMALALAAIGGVGSPALAVGPADPATSTITANPTTITANATTTSTITVQAKDSASANLTTGGATVQLFTTAGSLSPVTDNGNGTYTAALTSNTTVVTATISGKLNGTFISDDATVAFEEIADATKTTMAASPTSITADGTSTSVITVQAKKANDTNKVAGGEVVTLSTTKGTFPAACTSDCPATDNGNGTYSLTLTSTTTSGTATITGKIHTADITTTSPTVQMVAGPPSATTTTITASPTSIQANSSATSTITVQAKDVNGNSLAVGGATVTVSTTRGTFSGGCTSACPATDGGNGAYTATLTASASPGTATVTGKINTVTIADDATVEFGAGPASNSTTTITSNKSSIPVSTGTATITVQAKDSASTNLTHGGDTVTLNTTQGTLDPVTDNNDGTYTTTLHAGGVQGTALITGTINGLPMTDNEQVTIRAAADTSQSTIAASPSSITANGTSTTTVTFQAKNVAGVNLSVGGDDIKLSLSPNAASSGSFPAGCRTDCPATDNNNGTYTLTLTSSTVKGTITVTATSNGDPVTNTGTVTFSPGAASTATSLVDASPASIPANGTSTSTITVTLKDAFGNALESGGASISVLSSAGSLSAVTDNLNGTYTATLTSTNSAALATVVAKIGSSFIADDAKVAFIGAANAAQSAITRIPTSIPIGGSTSTITVQVKDSAGNNLTAGGDTVRVTTTLGTFPSACTTSCTPTDNGNGTYTIVLTSGATPGTATITGTVNSVAIGNPTTVIFEGPASPGESQITASPTNIQASGASTSTITVQLKDSSGNNRTTGGDTVVLSTNLGSFPSACTTDCSPTDNGNGTYSLTLTSGVTPGTATITGKVGGSAMADDASVVFREIASKDTSQITALPTQLTANGSSTSAISVQLKTAANANVTSGGDTVTLTPSRGTMSSVTDNHDGTYSATLTSSTSSGTSTITGTVNGQTITDNATVLFVAPASAATTLISASPTAIVADGVTTSLVTVQVKDAGGNNVPVGGDTIRLSTSRGSFPSSCTSSCTPADAGNGTYTLTLKSSASTGIAQITGTVNGAPITDDASVSFVPASSAANSTISANPTSIVANGVTTTTITVQVKDGLSANVTHGGETVVLTPADGTFASACTADCPTTDNGDGTYAATLTSSTQAHAVQVSGKLNGTAIGHPATVTFAPGTASAATSTITASPTSIVANGTDTSTITALLKDANGNSLTTSGGTVTLNSTAGTLSSVLNNGNGTYTATLTAPGSVGSATITGTLNGSPMTDDATVSFVPGPASAATTQISASPTTMAADGASTSTITVQAKDSGNNNLTVGGAAVTLGTTLGSLGSVTDNANGTYTATLTAGTTTGTATITGTINSNAIADNATVTLTPGPASASVSQITASPTSIPANGTSTSTITVQATDANGNNETAGGDTVALNADHGTLGSVTDNGNGTYTATFTSDSSPATALITGTLNSVAMSDTATVIMTGPASAGESIVSALPTTIPANGTSTSTVTVVLKDAAGNNLTTGGDTVTLATTRGTFASSCTSLCATTDHGDGTYTAVLTSSSTSGTALITGKVNGTTMADDATVEFRRLPSGATSLITAVPVKIPSGGAGTATITVQLKDSGGTSLTQGGDTVALNTNRGTLGSVTDNGDGTYTATLTSGLPGVATVGGTVNAGAITDTATVEFKAPTQMLFEGPATLDDAFYVEFSDDVHGLTDSNFVLRLTSSGPNIPAFVVCANDAGDDIDCGTGPVAFAAVVPDSLLTAGQRYVTLVNPGGAPTKVKDALSTDVPTGAASFRASTVEQQSSLGSTHAWGANKAVAAMGGSYTVDRLAGARAFYRYSGSLVTWYTITGPDQGLADVYVDNVKKGTWSQYSPSTVYGVTRSFRLPAGDHVFAIVVRGVKGSASGTDTKVIVDAMAVDGVIDNTPRLGYYWQTVGSPGASEGSYAQTDQYGASMFFTFRGSSIVWYTKFGPDQGMANVYIDGAFKGTFDMYASSQFFSYRRFTGLVDGVHTMRIIALGKHRAGATGSYVAVDKWVVS